MSPDNTQATAQTPIETTGDAIVASMAAGGVDHLFFTSGSEIGFYQEAVAKARAHGHNNPIRLITVPHEHISLNAALGYAAVSGRPAATLRTGYNHAILTDGFWGFWDISGFWESCHILNMNRHEQRSI